MSMARFCFGLSFAYWNVSAMLQLIKIIKYVTRYFIRSLTLWPPPMESECILQMNTCVVQQIIPGKMEMHRLLKNLTAVLPRYWLTCVTRANVGEGIMMLCGGLSKF